MSVRIIDNKKVDVTEEEWRMYENICRSYDQPPAQKGKDLFIDLFESDDNGIIIYLKPPHNRLCSFEVFLFLMSLMEHQHLRAVYKSVDAKFAELTKKMDEKFAEFSLVTKKEK